MATVRSLGGIIGERCDSTVALRARKHQFPRLGVRLAWLPHDGNDLMRLTGSCFCGAVRYEVSASLRNARACHCSQCRKAFNGASSAYAEVQEGSFSWTCGEANLTRYASQGDWGLVFCRVCGSTLAGVFRDEVHGITLGTIDGDPGVEIGMHIHVASKAPWDHIGGDASQFLAGPGS